MLFSNAAGPFLLGGFAMCKRDVPKAAVIIDAPEVHCFLQRAWKSRSTGFRVSNASTASLQ